MNKQTETLSKATPRPWHIDGHNLVSGIAGPYGAANLTTHVFRCEFGYQKHASECFEMDKANASLIVQAVNQFEALCAVADIAKSFEENRGGRWSDLKEALAALEAVRKGIQ